MFIYMLQHRDCDGLFQYEFFKKEEKARAEAEKRNKDVVFSRWCVVKVEVK